VTTADNAPATDHAMHRDFLAILPKIEAHAAVALRLVPGRDRRADLTAEAVAVAWKWFRRLHARGKNPLDFPTALAGYAVRAVLSGRRLCGQERAGDVLSPVAQRGRGFFVTTLPAVSTLGGNPWDEALRDNAQSPVPDAAAFRIDFPRWLATLGRRDRRVAEDMMVGHPTQDVARAHRVSAARISQLRRELHTSWTRFTDPEPAAV
jgi:hypothetical protein